MERKRLFVAIDLSDEVRSSISEYVNGLKNVRTEGIRWESIEKIHLTLTFLGDTEAAMIPDIESILFDAASRQEGFKIAFEGAGVFPNLRKARVLWIGLKRNQNLDGLHADIENRFESIGVPKEDRRFSPHLTIARIKDARQAKPIIEQHLASEFGPIVSPVNQITLYESKTLRSGSNYSVVGRYQLKNL